MRDDYSIFYNPARIAPAQRATEAEPLPFAAGNEATALTQLGLQAVRQPFEHATQLRGVEHLGKIGSRADAAAVAQVL